MGKPGYCTTREKLQKVHEQTTNDTDVSLTTSKKSFQEEKEYHFKYLKIEQINVL